jgi:hypothetical protein
MTKIEEILNADAGAWCEEFIQSSAWFVNCDPVRILRQTVLPDGSIQVRAVMHVEFSAYPQSGSGWHEFHYRAVDVTFLNDEKIAETVLRENRVYNSEAQNESFDSRTVLGWFIEEFE